MADDAKKDAKKAVSDDFKRRKAEREAMTTETLRRMDEAKPTPTEEEMQEVMESIASGEGTIETEHEGVPEEDRMVTPQSVGSSYQTRDMAARKVPRQEASPARVPAPGETKPSGETKKA